MTGRLLIFMLIGSLAATSVRAHIVPVPSPYVMVNDASFIGEGRLSLAGNRWEFRVDNVIKGPVNAGDKLEVIDPAPDHAAAITYLARELVGKPLILFGNLADDRVNATYGFASIWPDGIHRKTFPADTVQEARDFIEALRSYQEAASEPLALIDQLIQDASSERRYAAIEFADQALAHVQELRDARVGNDIVTAVITAAWRSSPKDPYLDEKFLHLSPKVLPSIAMPELARIAGQTGRRANLARGRLESSLRIRKMIEGKDWTLPDLKRAIEENRDFLHRVDGEQALRLLNSSMPAVRTVGQTVLETVFEIENKDPLKSPEADKGTWMKYLEPLRRATRKTIPKREAD